VPTMNLIQAVNDALKIQMRLDERMVILGEDVGRFGGVFRATAGLIEEFGDHRVVDTPLAEGGIIGTAIGMAMNGLRPVPEIQFSDFIYPAFDQIVNELAKLRYRSGGQYSAPMVIRTPSGGGIKGGHYHSQSPEAYFIHTPGLKVVMPSNPIDAKGLLLSAMRGEDPVIFFEPKRIYRAARGDVPEEDYTIPLGQAKRVYPEAESQETSCTMVSWGAMVHEALEAAKLLADRGIAVEVIDLRTLWPLDLDTILESVRRTSRAVVVHEAPRTCGFGAEVVSLIQERAFSWLAAPISRVTGLDTPFPYTLELEYLPLAPRIVRAVEAVTGYQP
jgi:pyruvate dehydrogenase E1 component beta subunit